MKWRGAPALLVTVILMAPACSAASSGGSSGGFSGKLVNYNAVDTKHLAVQFSITNNGTTAGSGECTVEATNPFGDSGFDIFQSKAAIQPGETVNLGGYITVTNEGAESVDTVTVKDCGPGS